MAAEEADEKVGFLIIKAGNKKTKPIGKKEVYCLTAGSTLHCYKSPLDVEPLSSVQLKDCVLEKLPFDAKKKKATFNLTIGDNCYLVEGAGEDDCNQWIEEFKRASALPPGEAPSKEAIHTKKLGRGARMKKAAGGKLAASGAGKAMTRRLADEETLNLLRNLKIVIKKDSGSAKKAEEIENDIMKIAIKSFFLVDNKVIPGDAFLDVDGPIRKAFELMVKVWDKKERTSPESLKVAFNTIEQHLKKAEQVLTKILLPHLTAKSIQRVKNIFSYVGSARFLSNIMMDNELEDEVHELVKAIEYYTQFHHYKEDKH
jgi:hypothetical protein